MTFLPIVQRELLEASRRRGTYRVRLGVAAIGLLIGGWIMLFPFLRTPQQLGMTLFVCLAATAYLYSLLIGIFRTADCLSEEKREGTLGLLFLTDLKGYDIVFGKLFATSLNAFYGLLALFPVMAIPLLVGGVTINEFWRVVLVALNNMFLSLAVGMFCSSVCRDERRAMLLAFLMMLFLTLGFPLIGGLLENSLGKSNRDYFKYVSVPSPAYSCALAFDDLARGVGKDNFFTWSVAIVHGLSWLLLVAASVIVPRTWQDKAATPAAMRRREKLSRLQHGSSEQRHSVRRRWLELNPVYWLIARERMKVVAAWVFIGIGILIWALGLMFDPHDWRDESAYIWTALIAHTVFKLWVATEACRRFSADRQSGALELILSSPMSVRSIVRGQTMALERQFALPVGVVLLADFIFLLNTRTDTTTVILWIAGMVVLVADVVTLSWVGMWRGLNSRRPNRAAALSILQIMVLPWVIFALGMTFIGLANLFRHSLFNSSAWPSVIILIWLTIALAIDAWFGVTARRRLLGQFRVVATTRFETRKAGGG